MDEEIKKKVRNIQQYFNPVNLEPTLPPPEGLPGMTDMQRRLFEAAVKGRDQKSGVLLPKPSTELSNEEYKALRDEFDSGEIKPPVDIEEPKRFKNLLKK